MPRKKPLEMCLICFIISDTKSHTAMQCHCWETQQATLQNSTDKKEQSNVSKVEPFMPQVVGKQSEPLWTWLSKSLGVTKWYRRCHVVVPLPEHLRTQQIIENTRPHPHPPETCTAAAFSQEMTWKKTVGCWWKEKEMLQRDKTKYD